MNDAELRNSLFISDATFHKESMKRGRLLPLLHPSRKFAQISRVRRHPDIRRPLRAQVVRSRRSKIIRQHFEATSESDFSVCDTVSVSLDCGKAVSSKRATPRPTEKRVCLMPPGRPHCKPHFVILLTSPC